MTNTDTRALLTRREAAELITREFFNIKPKSLEKWPLLVRRLNGRAYYDVEEIRAFCAAKIKNAPAYRSAGRKA